jgi:hypothetical protein
VSTALGTSQLGVLKTMAGRYPDYCERPFHPGCSWKWENYSATVRILRSLTRRKLVDQAPGRSYWEINDAGREEMARRSLVYAEHLKRKLAAVQGRPPA